MITLPTRSSDPARCVNSESDKRERASPYAVSHNHSRIARALVISLKIVQTF
jgi:hypothetical protein